MAKTITTRLPKEYILGLTKIGKIEKLDTSGVIRKLLAKAIEEWKKEYAIKMYNQGKFSFGEAVNFSEINPWDFPSLLKNRKVAINLDLNDLEAELKTIKWKK